MRREGRLRGKPTSKSRRTGRRCRLGNHRCRDLCPEHPSEKSWVKRKHRCKRFSADVHTNPDLADFFLDPALIIRRGGLEDEESAIWCPSVETDVQLVTLDATVNSMIEVAFAKIQGSVGGDFEMDDNAAMAFTSYELDGGARIDLAGDATDIAAIELAFQSQLGIYENAVEGSSFSEFATQGWSTLSEESWSEVELSDQSDDENSAQDDWSMVDVDEAEARE